MSDLVQVVSLTVFHDPELRRDVFAGDVYGATKLHADDLKLLGLVEDAPAPKPVAPTRSKA